MRCQNHFTRTREQQGVFLVQVAFGRSTWSPAYWEQTSPLSDYKETGFGCCKSVFPGTICVPWVLKKMGCDISKDLSQLVPVGYINQ